MIYFRKQKYRHHPQASIFMCTVTNIKTNDHQPSIVFHSRYIGTSKCLINTVIYNPHSNGVYKSLNHSK